MKINALDRYALNISYSNYKGKKVLKENKENMQKQININNDKYGKCLTYGIDGIQRYMNCGQFIDLFV